MHNPSPFAEERVDILHGLIRAYPLGLVSIVMDGRIEATPLPFLLVADGAGVRLQAHMPRANPLAKLKAPVDALVSFAGPQAYISPSWYPTKQRDPRVVPTWNYAMVQVRGELTLIEDADWVHNQMTALTDAHESNRAEPWTVEDAPAPFVAALIRGLVGIEIAVTAMEGKWKVSQNQPVENQQGVIEGLTANGDAAMARLVSGARDT